MAKYNIVVWLDGFHNVEIPVEYNNEYELKKDVVALGINGVLQKKDDVYNYYPPHKIKRIEVYQGDQKQLNIPSPPMPPSSRYLKEGSEPPQPEK